MVHPVGTDIPLAIAPVCNSLPILERTSNQLASCLLRVTCGRRPGKNFLTFCSIGRVRSRVRPVDAAGVAAGPNALRGSGPKQKDAL